MVGRWRTLICAGFLGLSVSACQSVPQGDIVAKLAHAPTPSTVELPASSTPMPNGMPERNTPLGFVGFCIRDADQCTASGDQAIVQLDKANWFLITAVNRAVNTAIWPEDDERHYGKAEYWTIPTDGYGDCEDYALTKRKDLISAGLPERALRIAVVLTGRNNLHAVLTVATNEGDYVLDSETDEILPWYKTGFEWLSRQDSGGAMGWVAFRESSGLTATASIDH